MTSSTRKANDMQGDGSPPEGPDRAAGDGWVSCECAAGRHWGRFGAAGLLVYDPATDRVLLQLRGARTHQGGLWGVPGGARLPGESAREAALRETAEETDLDPRAAHPVWWSADSHATWAYTTVVARPSEPWPRVGGGNPGWAAPAGVGFESAAVEWVDVGDVPDYPLHPGFALAWANLA
ncbi:MAG: NUDIX hydrolase, partial [Bifidobacteriaceae bacterium]|nr:NUDIX hydrolase [Bifidobacteriaceae bacterium]